MLIEGQIQIIQMGNGRTGNRKSFPFFYSESVIYDRNYVVSLNKLDVEAVIRFTKRYQSNIVHKLISMFDPSTINYEHVKAGLLLCAVNSYSDFGSSSVDRTSRNRIHALLIGDPGLAKSKLLRAVTVIVPNSRYESGQNSSGKSLTAIVAKENESYTLRLGPA